MAIKQISQVSCSLNLGSIYSLSYSWTPQGGVNITIYFVNSTGEYTIPTMIPLNKANIRIGSASFSVYPIKAKISKASGRRIMQVDFVDDTFMLENYYITLTGRGCGNRVYQLGTPVDNRTLAQKITTSLDSDATQIAEFTEFPDLEYTFNDFLTILRQKFQVNVIAAYDQTVTNAYIGTFRSVLDEWMHFYNLSFFFENGTIKIFDPTNLTINLPFQPFDALSYEVETDITSTYGKTVFNYFQQEGKELSLNQAGDNSSGPIYSRNSILYPLGYESSLQIVRLDINQVIAAAYGKEFWFLYNYNLGSASTECGWTAIDQYPQTDAGNTLSSVLNLANVFTAKIDENLFNSKFEAYSQYGSNIAGIYYLSNRNDSIDIEQHYTWFDQTNGDIQDYTSSASQQVNMEYVIQPGSSDIVAGVLPETVINEYFPGINFVGGRMVYKDQYPRNFDYFKPVSKGGSVSDAVIKEINSLFEALYIGVEGSKSFDFSALSNIGHYIGYGQPIFSQELSNMFNNVSKLASSSQINGYPNPFLPRYTYKQFSGISTTDYYNSRSTQNQPTTVTIVGGNTGPTIYSDTNVIKAIKNGQYSIFYSKYSACANAGGGEIYYGYRFDPRVISSDIAIDFTFSKTSKSSYTLNRDLSIINQLVNNPLLPTLAQSNPKPIQRISFTVNYFYNVPIDFLTNGLIGMSIDIGDNGITSTYNFSNEMLAIPDADKTYSKFEQKIRNSWIRKNEPNQTVS